MQKFYNDKRIYLILLLPIGGLLSFICSFFPAMVERIYATGINKIIIRVFSIGTGIIPFSLAEIGLILLVIVAGWKVVWTVIQRSTNKTLGKAIVVDTLVNLLVFIGITYFVFVLLWGLNYYRLTFKEIAHFSNRPASTVDLTDVCTKLIDQANILRTQVYETPDGVMNISSRKVNLLGNNAVAGYQRAATVYPQLGGKYGKPKGVLLSEQMSYLGISGIYCPFTGEANVNMAIPDVLLPVTVCHEMAHQRGFAREDEANYIAYVTCKMNPDPDFRYSGYMLAVINSMKMLAQYDPERYKQLQQRYSQGVRNDLINNKYYWDKHNSIFGRILNCVNDLYLKTNRQIAGVSSYNRMVDLLILEYRSTEWD